MGRQPIAGGPRVHGTEYGAWAEGAPKASGPKPDEIQVKITPLNV